MATTTYTIFAGDAEVGTKSKKSVAVEVARAKRDELGVDVEVRTQTGHVAFALAAPKKIKMSAPYTRVVAVDADTLEEIDGKRVAYFRKRVGFALVDSGRGDYAIYDMTTRKQVGEIEVATTREAGRWFADEAPALRAQLEAANA